MPIIVVIAGVFIIVTAFGYSAVSSNREKGSSVATAGVSMTQRDRQGENIMGGEMSAVGAYKDGTYTASVRYEIPYGYVEPMDVSLTLVDGSVTDVSVTFDLVNPTSRDYQKLFTDYYKKEVIGKEIEDVSVARVGGASLTNRAFNQAINVIKGDTMSPSGQNDLPVSITLPSVPSVATSQFVINSVSTDARAGSVEYVVDHSYTVDPFLTEPMETTVVIAGGIITDVTVVFDSPDQISIMHQGIFSDQFYDEVVGQPIATASLARVSYASLTTKAFNDALKEIRLETQI